MGVGGSSGEQHTLTGLVIDFHTKPTNFSRLYFKKSLYADFRHQQCSMERYAMQSNPYVVVDYALSFATYFLLLLHSSF